jgi:integrase
MFSTIAHEKSGFKTDIIETQLAHSVGNSVSQAYNRAMYLDERIELMQWWIEYLQNLSI